MKRNPVIDFIRKRRKRIRQQKFFSSFIKPGDLVFDIGANHGEYTLAFAKLGANVVAVEPQQHCIDIIRSRVKRYPNVIIEKIAVGAEKGEATLHLTEPDQVSSISEHFIREYSRYDYLAWHKKEVVSVTTVHELTEKYGQPAFIKIDSEGWDAEIIKGMRKRPKSLCFEYATLIRDVCIDSIRLLPDGEFNFSPYEQFEFVSEKWMNAEEMTRIISQMSDKILHGDVYARTEKQA